MSSAATNFPFCLDYDSWTSSLLIGYGAHFRSAAVQLGHPNATSCGELATRWCKLQRFFLCSPQYLGGLMIKQFDGRRCDRIYFGYGFQPPNEGWVL